MSAAMKEKLRDPNDLAKEIWGCITECQFDGPEAIEYISDMLRDDRELLTRKLLNKIAEW
jgi:hypothetical protein